MKINFLDRKKNNFTIAGVMSGTSLDGLDISLVNFEKVADNWHFKILASSTYKYNQKFKSSLQDCRNLKAIELMQLDIDFGNLIGEKILDFIQEYKIDKNTIDAIASHGHTVFHQTDKGLTVQIGNGHAISVTTNIPCINDFRQKDVCLGGQGAPLVPIGDLHLFQDYSICLNLGGIANASFKDGSTIQSFDISPMNLSLNYIAQNAGKEYDKDGYMASKGMIQKDLLFKLNELNYYKVAGPKSLGIEWLDQNIFNIIDQRKFSSEDLMRTFVEHQVEQIASSINSHVGEKVLITGGGTFNTFFIDKLIEKVNKDIVIPKDEIIEFKEALIFAFLGVLYLNSSENVLSSVTGSSRNSVSGALYLPY
jgi:anhydro-N-acetylmuramic acid kinase